MPKYEDDDHEEKMSEEELDKLLGHIVEQATDDVIVEHIKAGFTKFGIEGTEDVFRRVYIKHPSIMERYQKLYDRLIGRTK
jgi:hypothetical protein